MAWGADLVADDGTVVWRKPEQGLWVRCPDSIKGRIEARGVGILAADAISQARLRLVVDLDRLEKHRLPPERKITILGEEVDLLLRVDHVHFAAAILQFLKAGRVA
jgi:HPr kinase/phosphorylase